MAHVPLTLGLDEIEHRPFAWREFGSPLVCVPLWQSKWHDVGFPQEVWYEMSYVESG